MAVGTTAALIGGAAVGLGGSVIGSRAQSKAAKSAAGATVSAAQIASDTQKEFFYKGLEFQMPYYKSGLRALSTLEGELYGTPTRFKVPTIYDDELKTAEGKLARLEAELESLPQGTYQGGYEDDFGNVSGQSPNLRRSELTGQIAEAKRELQLAQNRVKGGGVIQSPGLVDEEGNKGSLLDYQRRQLQKSLAARGLRYSGRAVEEEVGLVASEALRRQNLLQFIASGGANAAGAAQSGALETGKGVASSAMAAGEAQANSFLARGASNAKLAGNIGNTVSTFGTLYAAGAFDKGGIFGG